MVDKKLKIRKFAEELRDLGDVFHALGEVAASKRLSARRRRAILTAIKALSFACEPTRLLEFSSYLLNWPGELTVTEERRLVELGVKDKQTKAPRGSARRRKSK